LFSDESTEAIQVLHIRYWGGPKARIFRARAWDILVAALNKGVVDMRNKIVSTAILAASAMAVLAIPAAAGNLEDDAARCRALGFVKGTASFLQCLQLAAKDREDRTKAQAGPGTQLRQEEADHQKKCFEQGSQTWCR